MKDMLYIEALDKYKIILISHFQCKKCDFVHVLRKLLNVRGGCSREVQPAVH
jgi:hypothetical protein